MNILRHLGALATQLKRLITTTSILAACLLPWHTALADSVSITPNSRGCITRQAGLAKFVLTDSLDRQAVMDAVAASQQGSKIDPCLAGQLHYLPARAYAALAAKHPDKFQPLDITPQNNSVPATSPARAATSMAPQYRYIRVDDVAPAGLSGFIYFEPAAILDDRSVYGTVFTESDNPPFIIPYVSVYKNGIVTILHEGLAGPTNQGGTVGGSVITDPDNFYTQAALFHENRLELIPQLPGEVFSFVLQLNDTGVALIDSIDVNGNEKYALYQNGKLNIVDFGPDIPFAFFLDMNNQGTISGTTFITNFGYRGFRFDPSTGQSTLLDPLPTEHDSWALGINSRGDILGYSFIFSSTERIGVWDASNRFHTYFVEGTAEFPTNSQELHFNDTNLIVITTVRTPANESGNSYLIPKPGTRLNLADLVENLPPEQAPLKRVWDVSTEGSMLGFSASGVRFLLERIAPTTR